MSDPQPIEFSKVQAGDTIHIRRVENAGNDCEIKEDTLFVIEEAKL